MDTFESGKYAGNQVFVLSAMLAHNLNREMQKMVDVQQCQTTEKRTPLRHFEQLGTLRRKLIQRAGRLTRPQGTLTLTMSANPTVKSECSIIWMCSSKQLDLFFVKIYAMIEKYFLSMVYTFCYIFNENVEFENLYRACLIEKNSWISDPAQSHTIFVVQGSYTWGMAMGSTYAIRNCLSSSRVRWKDSQGRKCKGISVFSHSLALCRRTPCNANFFLLTGIADQNGAVQGGSPYTFSQSFTTPVYRNTGDKCRPKRNLTLRADANNILGWFIKTLDKRAYDMRDSDCSV